MCGKYILSNTSSACDKSYLHCLISLDLPSLNYRRIRGDLIFLYKLINGYFNLDFSTFFTLSPNIHTRGNSLKLYKPYTHRLCRSNYFSVRVINHWNQLPEEIVSCTSLNQFKSLIGNYFSTNKYSYVFEVC